MNAQSVLFQTQAHALGEAAEAWKAEHEAAMKVLDLESILRLAIVLEEVQGEQHTALLNLLFAGKIKNVIALGEMARNAHRVFVKAFRRIEDCVAGAEREGYKVSYAERFRESRERLGAMVADFEDAWPSLDVAEIEAGMAAIEAGRGLTAEDIRRDLDRLRQS